MSQALPSQAAVRRIAPSWTSRQLVAVPSTAASRYAESSAQSGGSRGDRIDGESRAKRFAGESQQLYRTCRAQPECSVGLQVTVLQRDLAVLQLVEIDAV